MDTIKHQEEHQIHLRVYDTPLQINKLVLKPQKLISDFCLCFVFLVKVH